jgi:hypothetical protein
MSLERLLGSLSKVKGRKGSWTACCPAHPDKSPSLAIRMVDDGRILLHCFGGCSVHEVLGALGMDMNDLFPDTGEDKKAMKPAFYATDLLRIIAFESLVVSLAANSIHKGEQLSEQEMVRMKTASERIREAARYANI